MALHYLETGTTDPCYNLAFEQFVLETHTEGDWLILWQNANTVVVGLNQNTAEEVNREFVEKNGIRVVRRMTGGGAVYHDLGNLNYSFISDVGDKETLSIRRFAEPVCRALRAMGVQAEISGRNDIVIGGRKVSGCAQRIYKERILHHGTLLFSSDREMIAGALNADPSKFRSKSAKSVRSRVGNIRDFLPETIDVHAFWRRMLYELSQRGMTQEHLTEEELKTIACLADEKYRSWEWNHADVQAGRIEDVVFYGDYLAATDQKPLLQALRGQLFERSGCAAILDRFCLQDMFGEISKEEILTGHHKVIILLYLNKVVNRIIIIILMAHLKEEVILIHMGLLEIVKWEEI